MSVRTRLVLSSALMLFLELALIRWTGANVLHLSYFSNFVLLGSFLGIGLGFLRSARTERAPWYFPPALALLVVLVLLVPVGIDRTGSDLIFFTEVRTEGPPPWVVLPVLFVLVAVVMMGAGELVGRCFTSLERLDAYRWDLVGSLLGIVAFTGLSFLRAPSAVWGVVVALLLWVLFGPRPPVVVAAASLVVVGFLVWESLAPGISWSPYYKVLTESTGQFTKVTVNGVPHQAVMPLTQRVEEEPFYRLPYERSASGDVGDVLVIGAGTGTDVALALREGATSVTAVEIDPRIQQIGVEKNPDRPYDDPRVTVVIDDGRAFLQRTDQTFDRIVFALPDSLTLVAGASQLRLESYLFTEEGLRAARERLRPGGTFAMYNFYREDWLIQRLSNTASAVFGHEPCLDTFADRSAVVTVGLTPADQRCETVGATTDVAPVHDDRPFLYLRDAGIPAFYLVALAAILAISLVSVRVVAGPLRRMRPYTDLFLLGAAFLLMETKAVTGFALLFGTTWVVNALVFGGVLVAVLIAVEVTRRLPRRPPLPVAYAALAVTLVLAWLVPASWLLSLPVPLRALAAVTLAFLPVFTANVVFATRFADTDDGPTAFGANLLGAMLGGCLEYAALLVGYPSLLVLAGVLYLGAFLARPRVRVVARA